MANSHPYISGAGNISQMILQLRRSFPQKVTSDTVKRLGLAPNNESSVINALQFVGLIDEEGNKTEEGGKVFLNHKDEEFAEAFSALIKKAYSAIFELHGDNAWKLDRDDLITFFRQSDQTSDAIGRRQANTFQVFATLSGQLEAQPTRINKAKSTVKKENSTKLTKKQPASTTLNQSTKSDLNTNKEFGLSVRVEINLPADGTKETYDNIFKSIKENLLGG
jgi:hypothetical protein